MHIEQLLFKLSCFVIVIFTIHFANTTSELRYSHPPCTPPPLLQPLGEKKNSLFHSYLLIACAAFLYSFRTKRNGKTNPGHEPKTAPSPAQRLQKVEQGQAPAKTAVKKEQTWHTQDTQLSTSSHRLRVCNIKKKTWRNLLNRSMPFYAFQLAKAGAGPTPPLSGKW